MRNGITVYNKANQVSEALDRGYHETITVAFMRLVFEAAADQSNSIEDFEQRRPELFDKRVLLRLYSRHRILSAEARATFVEPDLMPISLAAFSSDVNQLIHARKGHFLLESGHHGDVWLDLELLCLHPKRIQPFASELASRLVEYRLDAVCGPLVEGASVAMTVAKVLDVELFYTEQ